MWGRLTAAQTTFSERIQAVSMNAEAINLSMVLDHWNEYAPDRRAFVFLDQFCVSPVVLTFGQLCELSLRFAAVLKSRGVRRDDRVVVLLPNCPERVLVEGGIQYLGAVSVNGVCKRRGAEDLVHVLRQSRASTLVVDPDFYERQWLTLRDRYIQLYAPDNRLTAVTIPNLRLVVPVVRRLDEFGLELEGSFMHEMRNETRVKYCACPPPEPHHVCTVLVTEAGPGRMPKLVVHTHRNMIAASRVMTPRPEAPHTAVFMSHPLGSADGHFALTLYPGVTRVLLDERDAGWPEDGYATFVYTAIRFTHCRRAVLPPALVPPLYRHFWDQELDDLDINRMHFVWLSGDKVSRKTVESALCFSNMVIISYTTCELLMSSLMALTDADLFRDLCVGCPVYNAFARIVSPQGDVYPPDVRGLLEIRSPLMFKEYLNNPELTRASLTDDGFFKTGDFAWMDLDEHVFLEGRESDAYPFLNFVVEPSWLEAQIQAYDGVENALVVMTTKCPEIDDEVLPRFDPDERELCVCLVFDTEDTTAADVKDKLVDQVLGKFAESDAFCALQPWTYFLRLEHFPVTREGRIDRHRVAVQATLRIAPYEF